MQVSVLKSKLHQARITDANLEYVGSITIDTQTKEFRKGSSLKGRSGE